MSYDISKIVDHSDRGVAHLLEQFKDKARLEVLARSYLDRVQELEDAIWEVITIRGIDASEGLNLDAIGVIVKRPRLALSDSDYRIALKCQVLINRSSGTPNELLAITLLATSALTTTGPLILGEAYPATIWVQVQSGIPDTVIPILYDNLIRAKAGGVRLLFQVPGAVFSNVFQFTDSAVPEESTTHGFSDYYNPGTGGHLAGIL